MLLLHRSLLSLVLELPTSSPLLLAPIVLPLLAPIFFFWSLLQALIPITPLPQLVAAVSTAESFNFFFIFDRRAQASIGIKAEINFSAAAHIVFFLSPKKKKKNLLMSVVPLLICQWSQAEILETS